MMNGMELLHHLPKTKVERYQISKESIIPEAVQRSSLWFSTKGSHKYLDPNLIETSIKLVNIALAGLVVVALPNRLTTVSALKKA